MSRLLILFIRMYQAVIAPNFGKCCRFYPSCSNYTIDALRVYGVFKGSAMGAWRLLRCNPWNPGGVDFVPETDRKRIV